MSFFPCTVAFLPLTLPKEGKLASTVTQAATQVSQLLVHHSVTALLYNMAGDGP